MDSFYVLMKYFKNQQLQKKTNYFIDVTGRHCVSNFDMKYLKIFVQIILIYINLSDNLKFSDTNIYAGSKNFFDKLCRSRNKQN